MSKLLKEAQIRRFMTLAKIDTLSDGFVTENWGERKGEYKREDEDGVEKKAGDVGGHYKDYEMNEDDELEADLEGELGAEDELADEEGDEIADLGADLGADLEGEGSAVAEEDVVDIVATIANALEAEYGIAVDVEGGADAGPEDVDVDLDVVDVGGEPDEFEAEVEDEDQLELAEVDVVDEEEIVAEVLKRVTARLRQAMKENKKTRITRKRK